MEINLELTSKFCPYCSNDKAVDGAYQDIGMFAIMDEVVTFNDCEVLRVDWMCHNCGHEESRDTDEKTKKLMFQKICKGEYLKQ